MMTLFERIGNWYASYSNEFMTWMHTHPVWTGFGFVCSAAIMSLLIYVFIRVIKN